LKAQKSEIQLEEKETYAANTALSLPTFDADEYWEFVEDFDLSDAQKLEYLETIWSIVTSFVDLAFGLHPLQQACGKLENPFEQAAQVANNRLYLPHSSTTKIQSEKGETL